MISHLHPAAPDPASPGADSPPRNDLSLSPRQSAPPRVTGPRGRAPTLDSRRLTAILLGVLVALLWLPGRALGQSASTGTISGVIQSRSGTPLPSSLTVALVGTDLGSRVDDQGRFTLSDVAPGSYALRVSVDASEAIQGAVVVRAGATTQVTLDLDVSTFTIRGSSEVGSEGARALPLPGITVTSSRSAEGYVERHSDVGFGFPAAVSRVPQSIHVIPRRMMEEQRPVTLSDVVRNVAGVSAARNSVEPFRSFKLRGFFVDQSITDGIRNTNSLNIQAEGMANIERVEILRGPGGAVFGLGSPGGTVNIVTKKPLPEARLAANLSFGNFGYIQPEVDVTGPIGDSGLGYRLVATWEQRESFIDFVEPTASQVAPTVEWKNDSGLTVRYQGDWRRRELIRYISHPFSGTVTDTERFRLPRSLFTGEPDQGETISEGLMNTFTVEHQSGGSGLARIYARLNRSEYDQPSVAPASLEPDGRTLNRRYNRFQEEQREWVVGGLWTRRVDLGRIGHVLSAGFDVADWTYESLFERGAIDPLDVVAPAYGAPITGIFTLADSEDRFQQIGGYVQSVLTPAETVTLLLGLRWDRLVNETRDAEFDSEGSTTDSELSPRLGLSWEVAPGIVPFASWSEIFTAGPNFGFVRTPEGDPLGPERGRQYEVGAKIDIGFDLVSTVSVYDLERSNVPTPDPDDPFLRIPTGTQRARGAELFLAWEPEPISLFGSYAYTDAEVTEDTDIPVGSRLDNVPEHSWRVWASSRHSIGPEWVGGLKLGVHGNSAVIPAIGNEHEIPGFTIWEGGAFLERGPFVADLMVHNLTDDYYFLRGAFGATGVIPGDARRLMVTLGWRP